MRKAIGRLVAMCLLAGSMVAFAQSGSDMKQDEMKQDQMKHDDMKQDDMKSGAKKKSKKTKKDKMKHDEMKQDGMKKDDMKHDDMKKDEMKDDGAKKDEMKKEYALSSSPIRARTSPVACIGPMRYHQGGWQIRTCIRRTHFKLTIRSCSRSQKKFSHSSASAGTMRSRCTALPIYSPWGGSPIQFANVCTAISLTST